MPFGGKMSFTKSPYLMKPVHHPNNYDPNNNVIRQPQSNGGQTQGNSPAGGAAAQKSY